MKLTSCRFSAPFLYVYIADRATPFELGPYAQPLSGRITAEETARQILSLPRTIAELVELTKSDSDTVSVALRRYYDDGLADR